VQAVVLTSDFNLRGNRVIKREYGPAIGSHLGKPIYESIDQQDTHYVFDRLAECDRDGCPLDQLKKDEILFTPGLIYKPG
jgi:hypothetical protein